METSVQKSSPQAGEETLAQKPPAPQAREETPAQKPPAPQAREEAPAQKPPAPQAREEAPAQKPPAPQAREENPAQKPPAPQAREEAPAQKPPAPQAREEAPAQKPPAPQAREGIPAQKPPAPQAREENPAQKPPAPQAREENPAQKPPAPQAREGIPAQKPPAPQAREENPAQKPPAPQAREETPAQKPPAPQAREGIPAQKPPAQVQGETPAQKPPSPQAREETPAQKPPAQAQEETPAQKPILELPTQLGKYDLLSVLGQGSFGTVYQARDQLTGRKVAVKVLHQSTAQQSDEDRDEKRKNFFNEAHAAVMMRHPNILQVLDAGVEKDHCYIVTELVEHAYTLQRYTSTNQLLPVLQVVKIIFKCAAALDHIHSREVIHRDIKPENILVFPTGEVKIGDFGVAQVLHEEGESAPEELLGSPQYMAPEQLSSGKISYRTDFYSLGVIAYELLTGQHPFPAKSLQELCRKHQQAPPALTRYRLDLPPILQLVIERTLNRDPEKRYGAGEELAQDLSKTFKNLGEFNVGPKLEELLDSLRAIHFFSEFTPQEIKEVTEICICEEYKPGEAIICEGTINDSFYLVIDGNVKISKEGVAIDQLETGSCFGEMGYLTGIKRTATVTAGDHSHLVKINANLAAKLSPEVQLKFYRAFIQVLVNRLTQTTGMLISK